LVVIFVEDAAADTAMSIRSSGASR